MNDIQKSILGCVVPANGSPAEDMRCIADFVDTLEVEFASCMEDGEALHSEFAESSMSSQDSDPFSEILGILATPQYDDLAKQVRNTPVFPQERFAESSMNSQDSDLFAEIFKTKDGDAIHSVPAESSMSSQDTDLFLEISKIISTSQDDGLAKQATNHHVFPQSMPAIAGTSSQGSDASVRKKIKRTNSESSEAQQAQSKNADTAYSNTVCMNIDGRKLEINGRIIALSPKESVFLKLLFEKINTYVPVDDLYVAVYGGKAGDWKKDSKEEKKRFYSLLTYLRKKIPEDCFKGKSSIGYMLSGSVMTSQDSDASVRKKIKRTNDSDSFEVQQAQSKNADTASSKRVCMDTDGKKLNINGRIISLEPAESVFVKLLIEKINTYVPADDLYVAVYGGKAGDWKKDSRKERGRFYFLLINLRKKLPEYCLEGEESKGYMLSGSVMTSQDSDPPVRKKIKRTNAADSSEAQQAQSKNADTAYSKRACMRLDGRKLNINGRIISFGPKEFVFVKLLFEKINTYVPIDDLYVALYGGEAGDWKKDSKEEKKCIYSLVYTLRKKIPEDCFKKSSKGYMLSDSVMTSQDSDPLAEEAANFQSTSAVASTSSQGSLSAREEIKRTPDQNKMVYSNGIGINIEKNELEIDGESFVFRSQNFMALKLLFEKINTYVSFDDLYVAAYAYGEAEACQRLLCKKKRPYKLFYPLHNRIPEGYIKGNLTMGYMLSNPNDLVDVSYQGFLNAPKKVKGSDDADSSEAFESEEDGGNLQKMPYDRENYPLIGDSYTNDCAQFVKDTESIRRRYINIRKNIGFVRIGEIYVSFIENKFSLDGGSISLDLRSTQALRILALWYPNIVPYEQIYYNLSFGVDEDYACSDESLGVRKHYLYVLMHNVQLKLRSVTNGIYISSFKTKGYKLVCHPKRQACPNENSVQDTLHSQSTDSSS